MIDIFNADQNIANVEIYFDYFSIFVETLTNNYFTFLVFNIDFVLTVYDFVGNLGKLSRFGQ